MAKFELPEKNDDNAPALGLLYRILQRIEAEPENPKWRSLQNRVCERLQVSERGGDGNPDKFIDFLLDVGFVKGDTKLTLPLDRDLDDLRELRAQLAITEEVPSVEDGVPEGEPQAAPVAVEAAVVEQQAEEEEGRGEGVAEVSEFKEEAVRVVEEEEEERPRVTRKRTSRVGRRESVPRGRRRGRSRSAPREEPEEEPQEEEEGHAVSKAVSKVVVADPEEVDEPKGDGQVRKREVPVKLRVPYIRKVKVPVKAQKLIETEDYIEVTVKKLREVESFKDVEEKFIDMEERTETREREVWVKKIVREEYKRLVPVEKTRVVKARVTEVVEKPEVVRVAVPTTKIVEMDGFRIDEVEDWREEERMEWEEFTMVPRFVREYDGRSRQYGSDALEEGEEQFRHEGVNAFIEGDEELEGLPEDRAYSGGVREMITSRDDLDMNKARVFTVSEKPELRGTVRKRQRVEERDEEEDEEEEGAPKKRRYPATPAVPPTRRRDVEPEEDDEDGGKEEDEEDADRRLSRQPGSAVRRSARRAVRVS